MPKTANSPKSEKPWLFQKGQSGNPSGRPKNTLKDYLRRKFNEMTDAEKEAWLQEHKVPADVQWKMAEGNPQSDVTSDGKALGASTVAELDNEELERLATGGKA